MTRTDRDRAFARGTRVIYLQINSRHAVERNTRKGALNIAGTKPTNVKARSQPGRIVGTIKRYLYERNK